MKQLHVKVFIVVIPTQQRSCITCVCIYIYIPVVSLLVHEFHSTAWKVTTACMVISNNKQWFKGLVCDRNNVVSGLTSLTTNYLFPPLSQSACQKNLVTLFSY